MLEKEKVRTNITGTVSGATGVLSGLEGAVYEGYEIHMGKTHPLGDVSDFTSEGTGYCRGNVYGTYIHGFFDKRDIAAFVMGKIAAGKGKTVDTGIIKDYSVFKDSQYDKLAEVLRDSLDMDYIYRIMGIDNDNR